MAAEIIHDDNVTWFQCRHEELLDISGEAFAVDWAIPLRLRLWGTDVEHARRIDPVMAQRGQERHRVPVTIGSFGAKPLSFCTPPAQGSHIGLGPCLVNKDKPLGIKPILVFLPLRPPPCNLWPILL